jgi:hypothetical protein
MKSKKIDWTTISMAFQVGFCGNAALWRIIQNKTDDVLFPALIATLSLACLVIHTATKRVLPNASNQTPPPRA